MTQLTPKQTEVLIRIVEGRTVKQIAYENKLSVKTIETHRARIMDRLKIRHIPGLVRFAMRSGLVPVEQPIGAIANDDRGVFEVEEDRDGQAERVGTNRDAARIPR